MLQNKRIGFQAVTLLFLVEFLILGIISNVCAQEGYNIKVKINNFSEDTIKLANYLLDQQYLRDTAVYDPSSKSYTFSGSGELQPGMYLVVLPPNNTFFQILIDEEDLNMQIAIDTSNFVKSFSSSNTLNNKLFYEYLNFLGEVRPKADELNKKIKDSTDLDENAKLKAQLEKINTEVRAYQNNILSNYPDKLITSLIKVNLPADIPNCDPDLNEKDCQFQTWQYNKVHFFDNIDLADARILRMPFTYQRVNTYIEKLTVKDPDSISQSLYRVLDSMMVTEENYKFYLVHYLNKYANSKIVGFDEIYVNLVDRYYKTGKTPWTDPDQLNSIVENADKIKPLLLGKIAPEIILEKQDGSKVSLHSIDSPYTVLIFWDPECGHCKKSMPKVADFFKDYQQKGVEVLTVCTRFTDDVPSCWDFVEEKNMKTLVNTVDSLHRSRYKVKYDIRSTPQVYVLNKDKKIMSKKIDVTQLGDVIDQLIERETNSNKAFNNGKSK